MLKSIRSLAVLVLAALPVSTAMAHGHGGGMVVTSGPAASISAPATAFYGGYGPPTSYAPTTSGYSYAPATTYLIQPTGAYVPGMSPVPSNFGYARPVFQTAYPANASPYGRPMHFVQYRRVR